MAINTYYYDIKLDLSLLKFSCNNPCCINYIITRENILICNYNNLFFFCKRKIRKCILKNNVQYFSIQQTHKKCTKRINYTQIHAEQKYLKYLFNTRKSI